MDWGQQQLTIGADGLSKNYESRAVDFNAALAGLLEDMRSRSNGSAYLFPAPRMFREDAPARSLKEALYKARALAGVDGFGYHNCRHYFISHAVMSGIDYMTIARCGSAGGHLSLLTGMLQEGDQLCNGKLKVDKTRKVAAIVNWFGVTDFNHYPLPTQWFGDNIDTEEYIRTLSPINYVRKNGTPVLSIHGTEDPAVSVNQTISLHKKLRESGINEKMYLIEGKKHGEFTPQEFTQIYKETWKFLESAGVKTTVN